MQPIAAWLVARPLHGVLGLAISLLAPFPFSFPLSGTVMVLLVLANGIRLATIKGLAAGALLAIVALVVGASVGQIVMTAMMTWLPVMLLAGLVRLSRSVTLAMQVSVILAMLAVLAFFVVQGDPTVYWDSVITDAIATFRESGAIEYADWLSNSKAAVLPLMSMFFVFIGWSLYTLVLFLGYAFFQALPEKAAAFGRFCDLNLGRVLAIVLAVSSVLAVFVGSVWLTNVAFMLFVAFWLQGLAILHWLHAEKRLPTVVLIVTYVFVVPLLGVMMVALAVLGYLDAWFNIRARRTA